LTVALRLASGLGGVVIMLTSALFTLGASLAAPIGILVAQRRARRKGRPLTRGAAWLSAVFASIITVALGLIVLVAFTPASAWREIQKGTAEARVAQDTLHSPAWITKVFPRTAQSDSVAQKVANSPGFLLVVFAVGVLFTCAFFGALGGTAGWMGSVLLSYAFWGSLIGWGSAGEVRPS
jgi:ABC-type dipeptide/oligopeptide/nickel transport system permease component